MIGTAIDTALPEILRALRQDRTHVVLVVSHDLASQLVAQLTKELVDTMRVGIAHFAGQDESSAAECVLSALGVLGAAEAPINARIELERLAQVGTSLILGILVYGPEGAPCRAARKFMHGDGVGLIIFAGVGGFCLILGGYGCTSW